MSDNPLAGIEFLVLEFDPRDASLKVLDDYGYSARSRDDAIQGAQQASESARSSGLPMRYVVRIATEATFSA